MRPQKRTVAARRALLDALAKGVTLTEACRTAGITTQTVTAHAAADAEFSRQLDAVWDRRRGPRPDTSWHQTALDAVASGASYRQATRLAGVSAMQITEHRDRYFRFAVALAEATRKGEAVRTARKPPRGPAAPRLLKPCGTRAAYDRHLRNGEEPCTDCRKAHNQAAAADLAHKIQARAGTRARGRLAKKYRREYKELVRQERSRTDRSPSGVYGRAANALAQRYRPEYLALVAHERELIRRDRARRDARNQTKRNTRRQASRQAFRPVEEQMLTDLSAGDPLADAVARAGVTTQTVFNLAKWDKDWAGRLDQALMQGRDPSIAHGTEHSYKAHRCRCPECRDAKSRRR